MPMVVHAVFSVRLLTKMPSKMCRVRDRDVGLVWKRYKLVYWKFDTQGSIVLTARREKI